MNRRNLLVIHVDGVGFDVLNQAVERGTMRHLGALLKDGYTVQPYRTGIPCTTPYAQAGILYGDNRNIAGFRWYDKVAGIPIQFGVESSFKKVAHRYFQDREGLATNGAAIAACYPAGARKTFGISFKDRQYRRRPEDDKNIIGRFLLSPVHVADVAWQLGYSTSATIAQYIEERLRRRHPAVAYMAADIVEEIFVHGLTRYAVIRAMEDGEPVIYAGFYAYDEAGHGFGPDDSFSQRMLRHLDRTLRQIFDARDRLSAAGREYEIVVLSDHGQSPTRPLTTLEGRSLGEVVSEWVPRLQVQELKGKTFGPHGDALDGHLVIAPSGGLAHLYCSDLPGRLSREEVEAAVPRLIERLGAHPGIEFALVRDRDGADVLVTADGSRRLEDAQEILNRLDDPAILARQLHKLNSFDTAGDVMVFGHWDGKEQINFENQLGGHGGLGGEQGHPFVMSRAELGLAVEGVTDASELYGILKPLVPPMTPRLR